MFNTIVDTFREKLLKLLDDVEQFFLWVVAAMLDGRKTGFQWLNPLSENKLEWLNVTYEYKIIHHLKLEVRQSIVDQVTADLLLCISIPLKCGPQALPLLLGSHVVEAQEDPRIRCIIVQAGR